MGAAESTINDVRVTDYKTIVKHKCLRRKKYRNCILKMCESKIAFEVWIRHCHWKCTFPNETNHTHPPSYFALQASASSQTGEAFGASNVFPFLDRQVVQHLLPFLFGKELTRCMEVCPLWFVSMLRGIDDLSANIDEGFKKNYSNALNFEYARTDWSPVHTHCGAMRVDRIIIARVKSAFAGRCLNLSYSYKYDGNRRRGSASARAPTAKKRDDLYQSLFKLDVLPKGSRRTFWLHKVGELIHILHSLF